MMNMVKRYLCLLLCAAMLFCQVPVGQIVPVLAAAHAEEGTMPVQMDERLAALAEQVCSEAEAAVSGDEYTSGDYRYALTEKSFAVITGFTGKSAYLVLPAALDGHEVIAIWANAFDRNLTGVAVHGNVMYIHPEAFAAGTLIASRSGSYALAWAAQAGMAYNNATDGELVEGVKDLDDLSESVTRMSSTLLRVSPAVARRLAEGDIVFFTDTRDVADAYRVVSMRDAGKFVYLTVDRPEVSDVIVNMTLEGTVYATLDDFTAEEGVSLSSGTDEYGQPQIEARSVFIDTDSDTEGNSLSFSGSHSNHNVKLGLTVKYSTVEKVQYRIEIVDGEILNGTMVRDSTSTTTFDGSITVDGDIIGAFDDAWVEEEGRTEEKDDDGNIKETFTMFTAEFFLGTTGMSIALKCEWSLSAAVSGLYSTQKRTIETSTYNNGEWSCTNSKDLYSKSEGSLGGKLESEVSASATFKVAKAVSCMQIKVDDSYSIEGSQGNSIANGYPCSTKTLTHEYGIKVYVGVWTSIGDFKIGFKSKNILGDFGRIKETTVNHYYNSQMHAENECGYLKSAYCIYLETGTTEVLPAVSYADVITFDATINKEVLSKENLNRTHRLPTMQSNADENYQWMVVDSRGEYQVWDASAPIIENFRNALGLTIEDIDDIPYTVQLFAVWENNCTVNFDPVGGSFVSFTGAAVPNQTRQSVPKNGYLTEPLIPSRDFSEFLGWYESPIYDGYPWNFERDVVTGDMTLYAKWNYYGVITDQDPTATAGILGDESELASFDPISGDFAINYSSDALFHSGRLDTDDLEKVLKNGCSNEIMEEVKAKADPYELVYLQRFKATVEKNTNGNPVGIHITEIVGNPEKIMIPGMINDLPVSVDKNAFSGCKSLKAVRFNGSKQVASLSQGAFLNCTSLISVDLEDTSFDTIPKNCFSNCTSLKVVTLPKSLVTIEYFAFANCTSLTKVAFGNKMNALGTGAFSGCTGIREVSVSNRSVPPQFLGTSFAIDSDGNGSYTLKLEDSVLSLSKEAFLNCKAMTAVDFNDTLQVIRSAAFKGCSGLTEVEIPASVSTYQHGTHDEPTEASATRNYNIFAGCSNLKKLTIGANKGGAGITQISAFMLTELYNSLETLILRDGITVIDEGAFWGSSNWQRSFNKLQTVVLPDSLITIGSNAFKDATLLTSMQPASTAHQPGLCLPNKVMVIGSYAFSTADFVSAYIPPSVKSIGSYAFSGCSQLKDLTLSEGLESIGLAAFKGCSELTEVSIPASVSTYQHGTHDEPTEASATRNNNIFAGCSNLKKLTIGANKGGAGITQISAFMLTELYNSLETLILRDGITVIDQGAFWGSSKWQRPFRKLQTVVLPDSLNTIGSNAFKDATLLTSMQPASTAHQPGLCLPNKVMVIGSYAFSTADFVSAYIPPSVKSIGSYAFSGCSQLKDLTLSEGLESIGLAAFNGCSQLTEVSIPASVSTYAFRTYTDKTDSSSFHYMNIFSQCSSLKKLTIGGAITQIEPCMLAELYGSLETLILREGVTTIGDYAFWGTGASSEKKYPFAKLKNVVLPDSLTSIGSYAFKDATLLTSMQPASTAYKSGLHVPDKVTLIGMYTFEDADFTSATIPPSVKSIGSYAFSGCSQLKDLTLSEGLESIGLAAFYGCSQLTEVSIPASVSTYAFRTYTDKTDSSSFHYKNIFSQCSSLRKLTIGGAITQIEPCMLAELYGSLETLILREGVTTICNYAFWGTNASSEKKYPFTKLKTLSLPDSLTTIGYRAFKGMSALTTLLCGADIASMGAESVTKATDLKVYGRPTDGDPAYSQAMADYCAAQGIPYLYGEDMDLLFTASFVTGTDENIPVQRILPGQLLTAPPTPVRASYVFTGWKQEDASTLWSFETGVMPFGDITLVAQWEKESLNGYYRVENGEATLLSYARISGESTIVRLPATWQGVPVTGIADGAFDGEGITTLTLPAGLTTIAPGAFSGMDELESIYIADDNAHFTTESGVLFTKGLVGLVHYPQGKLNSHYELPESTETIANGAFAGHRYLSSIALNEGLKAIGASAFEGCSGLSDITLPDTLQTIGESAFRDCHAVTHISGGAALESIGKNAFFGTDSMCVFYGDPDGLLVRYAVNNKRYYNLYMVDMLIGDTLVRSQVLSTGQLLDRPAPRYPADNQIVTRWYLDEAFETEWDFASMPMPQESLTLYGKPEEIFTTEPVTLTTETTDETTGEVVTETTQTGVRITGYHGVDTAVVLPQTLGGYPVTAIGSGAFAGTGVTRITLHAGVTDIAEDSFAGLSNAALIAPAGSHAESFIAQLGLTAETMRYTLAFTVNGGAPVASLQLTEGEAVALPVPVRDGCAFGGWYLDAKLTTAAALTGDGLYAMPAADTMLYANWTVEETIIYDVLWETDERTLEDGSTETCVIITGVNTAAAHVVIPETIHGMPVREIERMAFASCETIRTISLPANLQAIGDYAFMGSALREITIPETVISIGTGAMRNCYGLNSVSWPATLAVLPDGVLAGCTALLSLNLPEGVTTLGYESLRGTANLLSLNLPQTLTTLEAYSLCGLTRLTTIALGPNVSEVDPLAFSGCTALTAFDVDDTNSIFTAADGVLCFTDGVGVVHYPQARTDTSYAIAEGAFIIEPYAFADAKYLEEILIPDGMSVIGTHAFSGCTGLKAVAVPDSVYEIGADAFPTGVTLHGTTFSAAYEYAQAHGIAFVDPNAEVILPESITLDRSAISLLLGTSAALTAQVLPAETASTEVIWMTSDPSVVRVNDGYLRATGCGTTEITAQAGAVKTVCAVTVTDTAIAVIPQATLVTLGDTLQFSYAETTDNVPVTQVFWSASAGSTIDETGLLTPSAIGVVEVTGTAGENGSHTARVLVRDPAAEFPLPSAVRTIEAEAFASISLLRALDLRGSKLTSIGSRAFANCANLVYICIPDTITDIAADAFVGCTNLTILCSNNSAAHAVAEQGAIAYLILDDE